MNYREAGKRAFAEWLDCPMARWSENPEHVLPDDAMRFMLAKEPQNAMQMQQPHEPWRRQWLDGFADAQRQHLALLSGHGGTQGTDDAEETAGEETGAQALAQRQLDQASDDRTD